MRALALTVMASLAMACGSPQPSPPPPPSERTEAPAAVTEVASVEDQQRAKELADAVCGCVRERGNELACVRKIQAAQKLPRTDPEVARQIERARICVRLAELQDREDPALTALEVPRGIVSVMSHGYLARSHWSAGSWWSRTTPGGDHTIARPSTVAWQTRLTPTTHPLASWCVQVTDGSS